MEAHWRDTVRSTKIPRRRNNKNHGPAWGGTGRGGFTFPPRDPASVNPPAPVEYVRVPVVVMAPTLQYPTVVKQCPCPSGNGCRTKHTGWTTRRLIEEYRWSLGKSTTHMCKNVDLDGKPLLDADGTEHDCGARFGVILDHIPRVSSPVLPLCMCLVARGRCTHAHWWSRSDVLTDSRLRPLQRESVCCMGCPGCRSIPCPHRELVG